MIEDNVKPLIVAVSGGVDSMVLLDMLAKSSTQLIVAHVNHGIRDDSHEDAELVKQVSDAYNLTFVSAELHLGSEVSEEFARSRRYEWLEGIREKYDAYSIATAHHQDDVVETIAINVIRGTGWRGLCSLRSTASRLRPLLNTSKAEIIAYAIEHEIMWREDSTNFSYKYLRNRVRERLSMLDSSNRKELLNLYKAQCRLREEIEADLERFSIATELDKDLLIGLPVSVAKELLRTWLPYPLEQRRLKDLLDFVAVAKNGDLWSLDKTRFVKSNRDTIIVQSPRD